VGQGGKVILRQTFTCTGAASSLSCMAQ
jgi:hypothetical protein